MDTNENKSRAIWLWVVVLLVALVLGWYFYLIEEKKNVKEAESLVVESAIGGTLPEIAPESNPAEKLPEVNPVKKANPFGQTYKNPFE